MNDLINLEIQHFALKRKLFTNVIILKQINATEN